MIRLASSIPCSSTCIPLASAHSQLHAKHLCANYNPDARCQLCQTTPYTINHTFKPLPQSQHPKTHPRRHTKAQQLQYVLVSFSYLIVCTPSILFSVLMYSIISHSHPLCNQPHRARSIASHSAVSAVCWGEDQ